MFENFSRRHHLDKPKYDLKYEYVPPAFRMDIYKLIKQYCHDAVDEYILYRDTAVSINKSTFRFYHIEEIEQRYSPDYFIQMMLDLEWHEVLSVVEYLIHESHLNTETVNNLFEYHNVGYRVKQKNPYYPGTAKVVVYYDELLADNDKILNSDIPYQPVIESIQAAKKYLIDPQNIDIANSILSSIKAVEGYLKGYFKSHGKNPATLDGCIKELQKQKMCPENIIKSLENLYIYRNRTENVAHGSPLIAELSNEDALLCNEMAISFINYFHRKFTGV